MAAPTLQAEGTLNNITTGNNSPTIPTHRADDILILASGFWGPNSAVSGGSLDATPTPATWALITETTDTQDGAIAWFWRRATVSTTTVTVTRGADWDTGTDTAWGCRVYVIRGCPTTGNPWDQTTATSRYTSANQAVAAVTVSGTERTVIHFEVQLDDYVTAPTVSGWTAGTPLESTNGTDHSQSTFRKSDVSASTTADASTVEAPAAGYYAILGVSFTPLVVPSGGVMWTKQIIITAPTSVGQVAYGSVGFQGKLLLLHAINRLNGAASHTGDGADAGMGFGAATSNSNMVSAGGVSRDAQATSVAGRAHSDTLCLRLTNGAGTSVLTAQFVSWDVDGFTLDWVTVSASDTRYIYATVIGGPDVLVSVGSFAAPGAIGLQDITGLAFRPNTLIFFESSMSTTAIPGTGTYWRPNYGFVDSAGTACAWAGDSWDAQAAAATKRIQSNSACIIGTGTSGGGDIDRRATFTTYFSTGFTIDWTALDATVGINTKCLYVALYVPFSLVAMSTKPTTAEDQRLTTPGFTPQFIMAGGDQTNSTNASSAESRVFLGLGVGPKSGDQGATWAGDEDTADPTNASTSQQNGQLIIMADPGGAAPGLTDRAKITSCYQGGLTLNWDTCAATAARFAWLAMGTPSVPYRNPMPPLIAQ
jgi:hypothetical protein